MPADFGPSVEHILATEARRLLSVAAAQQPTSPEQLRAFARACIEQTDIGQLALAVLDGGLFAPRRALELAGRVLDRESGQGAQSRGGRGE